MNLGLMSSQLVELTEDLTKPFRARFHLYYSARLGPPRLSTAQHGTLQHLRVPSATWSQLGMAGVVRCRVDQGSLDLC